MTRIILTLLLTLPLASLLALDRSVYATLENELETLVDGAGDVWAYSGNGGYVFKFEKDVVGGPEKELFVNFSVRPNVWHIFTGGDNRALIGEIMFPSFDFKHSKKEGGQTRVLRSYRADSYAEPPFEPFGNYVLEKHITDNGIESKVRKVGVDATENEFNELRSETESETISWAKPAVQAIALKDLLFEPDASWFEFNPDEAQVRNGYYRLPGDEARTSVFESTFTPKVALEALNQKLGVSRPNEDEAASSSGSPVRSTPTPAMAEPASSELSAAYQVLARSTSLPEASVDPTGRTLPKEFAAYLENENRGYDQFVAGLSADGVASFKVFKYLVGNLGAVRFTEFVVKNDASEKPSAFDFVLYSGLRELVHEYPAINDAAKADITRHWTSLAQSSNPVFRLLAINEAHRVIKDKAVALGLLEARTSEIDPVIVHALIDQLAVIGGDAAKTALTRISDNAQARRDQALSKAADDAIAKLK